MVNGKVHMVILGAGYAGLMTAVRLAGRTKRRKDVVISLVNSSECFMERPRLHEIATGKRPEPRRLVEMLKGTAVQFRQGWVRAIEPEEKRVVVETAVGNNVIAYDYLVYALGSQVDRDSVPGVREWAYTLDGTGDRTAEPLHERLKDLAGRGGQVVVVGAGPTGIEITGEIRDTFPTLTVSMVTRGEFGAFTTKKVYRYIREALGRLDVDVVENAAVKVVQESELILQNGETVPFDLLIWSGGFKVGSLASEAGIQVNERNQLLVGAHLQSLSYPEIFAIGDAGFPVMETGAPYRMSLFTALVTAAHTADNLVNLLKGKGLRPFGFSTYGQGIAIGRNDAIGFNSFPNDQPVGPILTGRLGLMVRNFFVWLILRLLTVERKFPGFFFWPGRNRGGEDEVVVADLVPEN